MNKVKRILDKKEAHKVADDLMQLFEVEDINEGHYYLRHNIQTIKLAISNSAFLTWDFFLWAHETDGKYDAVIAFYNDKNIKFGTNIFSEFIWLSKNPKVGLKLFKEALSFAKNNGFKYIMMSSAVKNKKYKKVINFYQKFGFEKDTESYIMEL
jgi:GNAT superfamily N-acetyltransferase